MRRLEKRIVLDPRQDYDGTQLASHWLRRRFGLLSDAIVAFRGGATVRGAALVDLADRDADLFIQSADMLHIMVERFECDLIRGVLMQRLLAAQVAAAVVEGAPGHAVRRGGDDVHVDGRKLTVSIATVSPTSTLIHMGINIDATGAPVAAIGLNDLNLDPAAFAARVVDAFDAEMEAVTLAVAKVAPAHGGSGR